MKRKTRPVTGNNPSRRNLLKAAGGAIPMCLSGGALQILQGCSKAGQSRTGDSTLELGARDAIDHIQKGDMKAESYAAQLIKHYNAHKDLNVLITIDEARVMSDAAAVDQARARGDKLGALSGLPFVVKDQIDVAGYPTTAGNIALKGYVPKKNAAIVDVMVKNGGVVFAKANCADLAGQVRPNGVTSTNPYFGFVHNPYDPAHNPGGSSGGNGAAIAARIVPAGLGEDGGGSIRLPSASCGIAGLRPSTYSPDNLLNGSDRKRYSSAGIVPPSGPTDTFGPMARTVADVAFLDAVITGEPVPTTAPRDLRLGIPRGDYWENDWIDPGVAKATQDAFAKLRAAGIQLIEVDYNGILKINENNRIWNAVVVRPPNVFADWLAENVPGVTLDDINRLRSSYPALAVAGAPPAALEERQEMVRQAAAQYADIFKTNGIIALASPTIPIPAPLINSNGDTPGQKIMVNGKWVDEWDLIIYNLFWGAALGTPGLNVPVGLTAGLPVGMQLQGLPGDDSKVLSAGLVVENAVGRIPPPPFMQTSKM